LHPPRLLAERQVRGRPAALAARQLGRRLPLPLPRLDLRHGGRVFKDKPPPDNLEVPPHMYLSDSRLLIGEAKQA